MAFTIPKFDYKGIKRITIPKLDSDFSNGDFGWGVIKKYLPNILSAHDKNAKKIKFYYNYFLGEQDILAKTRQHKINEENNNKEVENHANRQVEFKVGFLCGERRDYTHKADSDSDDLIYLDRYYTDCNFYSKDSDLKEWIYATGIGVTQTNPRTDIIISDGIDELTLSNAAYLSEWQGNKEITLPFDDKLYDSLLAEKIKTSKLHDAESDKIGNTSYLPKWQTRW